MKKQYKCHYCGTTQTLVAIDESGHKRCADCNQKIKKGNYPEYVGQSTKMAVKLAERIKKEFDYDVIPIIHRVQAGYWQRAQGAWSWYMRVKDSLVDVGSGYTASDCLKAKKLTIDHSGLMVEIYASAEKLQTTKDRNCST